MITTQLQARDYYVRGGVSAGFETYDRNYEGAVVTTIEDLSNSDDQYDRLRLTPLIDIKSVTARDEASVRYSPGLRYDMNNHDKDIDHTLAAGYRMSMTRYWEVNVKDSYRYTDNVLNFAGGDETDVEIGDVNGRRTYWLNQLSLQTRYTYREDSDFTLGYAFDVLENVDMPADSDYEDYTRNSYTFNVRHRFNSLLKLSVDSSYTRGFYDDEIAMVDGEPVVVDRDLREYRTSAMIETELFERNPLNLMYSLAVVDYDETSQSSVYIHNLTLGSVWNVTPQLSLDGGAGPSYNKSAGQSGTWGYNARAGAHYAFEHGSYSIRGDHGYDQENFDGTQDRGLKEFWQIRSDVNYQLLQQLALQVYASYRDEDEEVLSLSQTGDAESVYDRETINRKIVSTGMGLRYAFWQWYAVSLKYDFVRQDSTRLSGRYDEHLASLMFSYENNLLSF